MAKFDVHLLRDGSTLVVDCQADLLCDLKTRLVVPLIPIREAPKPAARLNPVFQIDGEAYAMATQAAATIPVAELQSRVATLVEHDITIGNALDMLISGF